MRADEPETMMSPTIRSLVIPVSDLDTAKAVYTALLGSPHTDESYYVGYNINGFEQTHISMDADIQTIL